MVGFRAIFAQSENPCVGGSIPPLPILSLCNVKSYEDFIFRQRCKTSFFCPDFAEHSMAFFSVLQCKTSFRRRQVLEISGFGQAGLTDSACRLAWPCDGQIRPCFAHVAVLSGSRTSTRRGQETPNGVRQDAADLAYQPVFSSDLGSGEGKELIA